MIAHRRSRFESLEKRLALAVTAAVTDGSLVIKGDADGAVQIVAVSSGGYEVRDNGVLIADSTTLTGVNDDIKINIDATAGADNTVTIDLNGQTVNQVNANLGNGANSSHGFQRLRNELRIPRRQRRRHGRARHVVQREANMNLGNGDNSLTVNGTLGSLNVRGGAGADTVTLASSAAVTNGVFAQLGNGDNTLTLNGSIGGHLQVSAGDGADTVTLATRFDGHQERID